MCCTILHSAMIFRKLKFSDVQMPETSGPEAALWQMRAENSKVRENPAERIVLHILPLVDSGGPWRPGPPLPPKFVQNHAVSGIFKRKPLIKFWAQAPTWVKTLLGPTWPKSWIHPCAFSFFFCTVEFSRQNCIFVSLQRSGTWADLLG